MMDKILSFERNDDDDYYRILGCSELSTEEQITAEYRARVLDCHPDKHPGDLKAVEQFTLLSKAKDTLTDPEKRSKYDTWRRSGIAISYEDWCGLRGAAHTSMHWATKAPQPQLAAATDQAAGPSRSGQSAEDTLDPPSKEMTRERSPSPRRSAEDTLDTRSKEMTRDRSPSPRRSAEDKLDPPSKEMTRERSPSPRQASPYHTAQRVDLTFSSRDNPFVTGDEVNWTPQTGSDMLKKFRNYEI